VRGGKGDKDRITMLPQSIKAELRRHLGRVKGLHERDVAAGGGVVELPTAVARKFLPCGPETGAGSGSSRRTRTWVDRQTGERRRQHLHETVVQRAVTRQFGPWGSPSGRPVTACATASPPICWRMGTIFGRSRNYWGIRT
jgi:hypothetical protein